MTRERLTSIWSLLRRGEIPVRIYYTVRRSGHCRIYRLQRLEELEQ